jgi:hypothetical protein
MLVKSLIRGWFKFVLDSRYDEAGVQAASKPA